MSSQTIAKRRFRTLDHATKIEMVTGLLVALLLLAFGIFCSFMPAISFHFMLRLVVVALTGYGGFLLFLFFFRGRSSRSDLLFSALVLGFAWLLNYNESLPEWIVRTSFGWYCLGIGLVMAIQLWIHHYNHVKGSFVTFLLALSYALLGIVLLWTKIVDTQNLMRLFGVYFILLAIRMVFSTLQKYSDSYHWRRGIYVSLPTLLAAFLPEVVCRNLNNQIRTGKEYSLETIKRETPAKLRVMVHIGPEGFQKIGHFTFSWKGMVYSYGNYDTKSVHLFGTMGDGVYFTVPAELYRPNLMKYEHNTLFEYTIQTTPEQDARIEEQLTELHHRSVRWYSEWEKKGVHHELGELEKDYPSRLHYRTGAKFYKLKSGAFKTYWAAGDNCVLFSDMILGSVGADVLSLRGIITPGTYFDYLESEYDKSNSPIIERRIYSQAASQDGI
ncbi:MAG: hypothetical protein K2H85_00615 [Allobaculum sp.]|nr:hypothetical protein [Allobaculum sp.]